MKKLSRLVIIGLAALLVFALTFTACGNKGSGDPTGGPCTSHTWGGWTVQTPAGHHDPSSDICSDGIETIKCTRCGAVNGSRSIPCLGTAGIEVDSEGEISGSYELLDVAHLCIPPGATSIGSLAFFYNEYIQNVHAGANLTNIGDHAFMSCNNVTKADFPAVTAIDIFTFFGCLKLSSAGFPEAITIGRSAFTHCENLQSANFPKVTSIGDEAFDNCTSLEDVTLGVASITGPGTGTMGFPVELVSVYNPLSGGPGRYIRDPSTPEWTKQ